MRSVFPGGIRSFLHPVIRMCRYIGLIKKLTKPPEPPATESTEKDGTNVNGQEAQNPPNLDEEAAALESAKNEARVYAVEVAEIAAANAIWMWLAGSAEAFVDPTDTPDDTGSPTTVHNAISRLATAYLYHLNAQEKDPEDVRRLYLV